MGWRSAFEEFEVVDGNEEKFMKKFKRSMFLLLCMCFAAFGLSACKKTAETMADETKETTVNEAEESETRGGETADPGKETVSETEAAEASSIQSPSVCGSLSVKGTQLVDEKGEAVQLRGLSTHGIASFPQYVNEELFGEFRRE